MLHRDYQACAVSTWPMAGDPLSSPVRDMSKPGEAPELHAIGPAWGGWCRAVVPFPGQEFWVRLTSCRSIAIAPPSLDLHLDFLYDFGKSLGLYQLACTNLASSARRVPPFRLRSRNS